MPLTKRIIPCLDVKDGKVVKGTAFVNLRDMGDPVALAARYAAQGADELLFLDITATIQERKIFLSLIKEVARQVNIPFTVGGGISSEVDAYNLLSAGADKISVNSAAVKEPALVSKLAKRFGSQCVVLATDAGMQADGSWQVYVNGGRKNTGISALCWVEQAVQMGAGEILLTSINNDGGRKGFALSLLQEVSARVQVPVIASGGAGSLQHFADVFEQTGADAALAAGIFHEESITIPQVKQYLYEQKIPVRL